ncbi:UNKNOWN [Stylonychia lemnae]|uniref:Uncharacterized protein n=1 Tax=Stylonychia lemnae TaxID=5949 RepID=A0A078B777_STYLE|nr:UNKNOWN [Stylonychia lemnae]|eukprot:CDW89157.1 UNKNOWN [Stylonychia lemnae]
MNRNPANQRYSQDQYYEDQDEGYYQNNQNRPRQQYADVYVPRRNQQRGGRGQAQQRREIGGTGIQQKMRNMNRGRSQSQDRTYYQLKGSNLINNNQQRVNTNNQQTRGPQQYQSDRQPNLREQINNNNSRQRSNSFNDRNNNNNYDRQYNQQTPRSNSVGRQPLNNRVGLNQKSKPIQKDKTYLQPVPRQQQNRQQLLPRYPIGDRLGNRGQRNRNRGMQNGDYRYQVKGTGNTNNRQQQPQYRNNQQQNRNRGNQQNDGQQQQYYQNQQQHVQGILKNNNPFKLPSKNEQMSIQVKAELEKLGEASRAYSEKLIDDGSKAIINLASRGRVSLDQRFTQLQKSQLQQQSNKNQGFAGNNYREQANAQSYGGQRGKKTLRFNARPKQMNSRRNNYGGQRN